MNKQPRLASQPRESRRARNAELLGRDPRAFFQKVATWVRPMDRYYRRRWSRGVRKWIIRYHREVVFNRVSWMSVTARKMVLDAWVYQQIIY